ncbi:MAG: Rrf2 family transcriptional regulator [SAR202 cluster bacterium]|jgi:Rrf2 family protein|nr:Rrf2 family transcriptional regulator [SAR202 cluster bacterium]HJO59983.1 Rrf2 family transcriptional regulator [SAR202 cluster bacterium]|tara:strand:+ start:2508 stop:2936 length:429 start_codon:yes stop_codon:yes gene_type:complete
MHVPIKVDYGVRALVDLAIYGSDGNSLRSSEISERTAIPNAYLAQVLNSLKRAGFVKSIRGPNGGHELAVDPDTIHLNSIMEVLDSTDNLVNCMDDDNFCVHSPACAQKEIWRTVEEAIHGVLFSITVADLARRTQVIKLQI